MLKALLTNIQVLAKCKAAKKSVCKEPYFNSKWGDQAAFKKNIDRSSFEFDTQKQEAEIHDRILVMYKTAPKKAAAETERMSFLNKLTGDSLEFIQERKNRLAKVKQEEDLCQNSMAAMTEHIFEILKSYSFELNNALGFGPLHVAATNPQTVTEVVKFNSLRQPEETISYYRARLSTPAFSLVLRGDKRGIQFFLIPVERALGLSKQECHFLPIMRLSTRIKDGSVNWETDCGKALTPSMVELICMDLFHRLIEESKKAVQSENTDSAVEEVSA